MTVGERVRMARLIEKAARRPEYTKQIGIIIEKDSEVTRYADNKAGKMGA